MKRIDIRRLLSKSTEYVSKNVNSPRMVEFEDGANIELNAREIIYTRILMSAIDHLSDKVALDSSFNIRKYYVEGIHVPGSTKNFNSNIIKKLSQEYLVGKELSEGTRQEFQVTAVMPTVYKKMYEALNATYNGIAIPNTRHQTGISVMDFIEIQKDPRLMEAINVAKQLKTPAAVNATYVALDVVMRDPKYSHNPVAVGYITGTMNKDQLKQMLASRGFVTEINSSIFKTPVTNSFVMGLSDIYEFTIESRAAVKAAYLSKVAVEKSEYFAREWQLVTSIVERIWDGDCGSTSYNEWYVRSAEDSPLEKDDLDFLIGKWYLDEKTKKLKPITKYDRHLIGKTIKMRDARKCTHEDPTKICSVCYGELAFGIHAHTGLGYISSTTVSAAISQKLLSAKHLTSSAKSTSTKLDGETKNYFVVKDGNNIHFRSSVRLDGNTNYKLMIPQEQVPGLATLNESTDVSKLYIGKISTIDTVFLEVTKNDSILVYEINLKTNNRCANLTKEALSYVINNYTLDDLDRVIIDLTEWNNSSPLFNLPEIEFNFLELSNTVKNLFKYMKADSQSEFVNSEDLLKKVFDLVNLKLNVNIALLETIIYAFSVADAKNSDYNLHRNKNTEQHLQSIPKLITNRGLGAGLGWEKILHTIIYNPTVYYEDSIRHPMNVIINPKGVVDNWRTTKNLERR